MRTRRKPRAWLEKGYLEEGLTIRELAAVAQVSPSTIWRWMSRYHIPTRKAHPNNTPRCYRCRTRRDVIWVQPPHIPSRIPVCQSCLARVRNRRVTRSCSDEPETAERV